MATVNHPFRRVILASGFAAAIAISPLIAGFYGSTLRVGTPTAACPAGRNEDPYAFARGQQADTAAGAPSETGLTQCSGRDQGECVQGDLYATAPVEQPDTTVQQGP